MTLGTSVSGWPCAEVSDSMYYKVILGTGSDSMYYQVTLGTGVSGWPCAEIMNGVYY